MLFSDTSFSTLEKLSNKQFINNLPCTPLVKPRYVPILPWSWVITLQVLESLFLAWHRSAVYPWALDPLVAVLSRARHASAFFKIKITLWPIEWVHRPREGGCHCLVMTWTRGLMLPIVLLIPELPLFKLIAVLLVFLVLMRGVLPRTRSCHCPFIIRHSLRFDLHNTPWGFRPLRFILPWARCSIFPVFFSPCSLHFVASLLVSTVCVRTWSWFMDFVWVVRIRVLA